MTNPHADHDNFVTRKSLLMRACDQQDYNAWEDFISLYKKFIFHILNKMLVNKSDIEDLSQQTLIQLWKKLPQYDHSQGKFRSWLSMVVRSLVLNYWRSQKSDTNKNVKFFNDVEANSSAVKSSDLDQMIESEWKLYLVNTALENLSQNFTGQAIDVFKLSLEGLSNNQISERLEIKLDSVKVLKSRVRGKCINEIERLTQLFDVAEPNS